MPLAAQQAIWGRIIDDKGKPVAYANVYLEGSYDGTISDSLGVFSLETSLTGEQLLRVSYIGYETWTRLLELSGKDTTLAVELETEASELDEVTIMAGTFTASDRKKSATLDSYDIATTASAMGDIYGAYATMPGSQRVGEEGMLFVRGGDSYETRTYMDGLLVQSPYFANLPEVPTRGRYSPLLFSETVFSTGGYSAEYGQALSSVVDLTTNGLETENKSSLTLMTVGGSASMGRRWNRSSLALSGLLTNNALPNRLFRSNIDWIRDPFMADATMMFRQQVGESGLLKVFTSCNYNGLEMNYDNFPEGSMDRLQMKNQNVYTNFHYSGALGENWLIRSGMAWNRDMERLRYRNDLHLTTLSARQARVVVTRLASEKLKVRLGADLIHETYDREFETDSAIQLDLNDRQPAAFTEADLKLHRKLALRLGVRGEYSSLLEKAYLSPRVSAAFKTGAYSQVSLAWGTFYQTPGLEKMMVARDLSAERAVHYILNFQYRRNRKMLRMEAYVKQYSDLVKYRTEYSPEPGDYSNNGSGYARGVDLFWRDQSSLKGLDYWVSYSYLDTERDYKDFPYAVAPSYASAHNLSLVCKYFFSRIVTFGGFTYSFASPRPYHDPNRDGFMQGRTPAYHDLSLTLSHLTALRGNQLVIHLTVSNLLGVNNIYDYQFTRSPGEDGQYASQAVIPASGRQAVLLFLISL